MSRKGKIYVVGIGPGKKQDMTYRAYEAMENSDVIVGYKTYTDLVKEHFKDKEIVSSPMMKEVDRCNDVLKLAQEGKNVSLISSGDAGIYGMAGIMYEIGEEYPEVEIEVLPGVTAAMGGAAVLGAPLGHDCCLISLSDLLTPWETIEKRLHAAGMADFVICLYNPSSKKRADYLQKACDILLQYRDAGNICGYVKNIGREGEAYQILSLKELRDTKVDMFTTVFIGNSRTMELNGRMVTPRGYKL